MVYEADPSWEGPSSMASFFSTRSATAATADPAPSNVRFGENESVLNVDATPKGRRVAFDFSTFQRQHEEAAWTLTTFSFRDSTPAAATATATAAPQALLQQQLQYQQEQQDQKMRPPSPRLCVDTSSPAIRRPCLVVGPGQFGGQVGLLDGLCPPELIKYLTPDKGGAPTPSRAPRTDLSHLTEEEKVDRHREQSRLNGQFKRDQLMVIATRLEREVEQMRAYQRAIDMAPFVMVVVSAHINNCRVLYVNKTVTEILGYEVDKFLGSSFVMMAHPQDWAHLSSVLNECIRTSQPHHRRVLCRLWGMKGAPNNHQQPFKQMDMTVNIGTLRA